MEAMKCTSRPTNYNTLGILCNNVGKFTLTLSLVDKTVVNVFVTIFHRFTKLAKILY